jgi:hypothetical protein
MLGLIFDRTRDTCLNLRMKHLSICKYFIWEGKVNQIKRDVCCLDIENGA